MLQCRVSQVHWACVVEFRHGGSTRVLAYPQRQLAERMQGCSADVPHLDEAALQRLLEHDNFETRRYSIVALFVR